MAGLAKDHFDKVMAVLRALPSSFIIVIRYNPMCISSRVLINHLDWLSIVCFVLSGILTRSEPSIRIWESVLIVLSSWHIRKSSTTR